MGTGMLTMERVEAVTRASTKQPPVVLVLGVAVRRERLKASPARLGNRRFTACKLQPRSGSHDAERGGFTLVELVVVISIIAILIGLLLAGLRVAKRAAHSAVCQNNLRQYGLALRMYADDAQAYPPYQMSDTEGGDQRYWEDRLQPYTKTTIVPDFFWSRNSTIWKGAWPVGIFLCPSYARLGGGVVGPVGSYGYNAGSQSLAMIRSGRGLGGIALVTGDTNVNLNMGNPGPNEVRAVPEGDVVAPSDMIAVADAQLFVDVVGPSRPWNVLGSDWLGSPASPGYGIPLLLGMQRAFRCNGPRDHDADTAPFILARHGGRWNVVFCDNHVESLTTKALFDPRQDAVLRRWNRDHQPHREDVARVYAW